MKLLEAFNEMDKGKKIRHKDWKEGTYICKNEEGKIVWQSGYMFSGLDGFNFNDDSWQEYEERKDAPQLFKDLYKLAKEYSMEHIWWGAYYDVDDDYIEKLYEQLEGLNKIYKLDE